MNIEIQGVSEHADDSHAQTLVIPAQAKHAVLLNMLERFTSRKFLVCVFLEVASTTAAFMRVIEPGTWLAFGTLVLGTYCAANISDKRGP